ncbi:putative uncharacterized protein DDB_G0282133 [Condylostylus longicornis]|uniref:putative uncharacterized protein DDB_G0282133 n=1 Tax=Condylostylus longicornis TaxID=2530218 RepID=UPI00244DD63B|nr:putative uncharacterized protein DDB_G0282133 [Condylostylus longicornis]
MPDIQIPINLGKHTIHNKKKIETLVKDTTNSETNIKPLQADVHGGYEAFIIHKAPNKNKGKDRKNKKNYNEKDYKSTENEHNSLINYFPIIKTTKNHRHKSKKQNKSKSQKDENEYDHYSYNYGSNDDGEYSDDENYKNSNNKDYSEKFYNDNSKNVIGSDKIYDYEDETNNDFEYDDGVESGNENSEGNENKNNERDVLKKSGELEAIIPIKNIRKEVEKNGRERYNEKKNIDKSMKNQEAKTYKKNEERIERSKRNRNFAHVTPQSGEIPKIKLNKRNGASDKIYTNYKTRQKMNEGVIQNRSKSKPDASLKGLFPHIKTKIYQIRKTPQTRKNVSKENIYNNSRFLRMNSNNNHKENVDQRKSRKKNRNYEPYIIQRKPKDSVDYSKTKYQQKSENGPEDRNKAKKKPFVENDYNESDINEDDIRAYDADYKYYEDLEAENPEHNKSDDVYEDNDLISEEKAEDYDQKNENNDYKNTTDDSDVAAKIQNSNDYGNANDYDEIDEGNNSILVDYNYSNQHLNENISKYNSNRKIPKNNENNESRKRRRQYKGCYPKTEEDYINENSSDD